MKIILLVGGLETMVDDDDYEVLNRLKWYPLFDLNTTYVNSSRMKRMHRIIMCITSPDVLVDHADGNGLNNQKSNLRICNLNQNNANRRPWKNKSSIYLGVYKIKDKYRAASRCKGVLTSAGDFESEYHAVLAYNRMAVRHHGEFARLNIYKNSPGDTGY